MKPDFKSFKAGTKGDVYFYSLSDDSIASPKHVPLVYTPITSGGGETSFSLDDLPSGEASYSFPLSESFMGVLPKWEPKFDLIMGNIKVTIEGQEVIGKLLAGEAIDVDWFKLVAGEWEFVVNAPFKINFKSLEEPSS